MNGLSTILSLIFKLLGKIFRIFGINAILTIFFVIELIACIGYASEMSDYDKNSRDYEFVGVESVVELDRNDPMIKELDILAGENDHYYLVRVKINNRYSERLSVPAMSAETENGDIVIARRITYYGDNMSNHSTSTYIPEGTQTVLTYMLDVSGSRLEETNVVKLFDFSGDKNKTLTIELPK